MLQKRSRDRSREIEVLSESELFDIRAGSWKLELACKCVNGTNLAEANAVLENDIYIYKY